jgi:nitrite reductase/ring-hydroxylating ferredoxin subunit
MVAAEELVELCTSAAVREGGAGLRFDILAGREATTGFVVRYGGHVHGYINRCAHVAMELDWQAGEFFDFERKFLICATHGALYEPSSGACMGGPCAGRGGLRRLEVFEREGKIYWRPDLFTRLPGRESAPPSGMASNENTAG